MIETDRFLATNRAGWNQVAPKFHGGTALPEYGPLAATEDALHLLELTPGFRALELGCGSGHSLRYLAERGATELWGIDLSPVQIAFAQETLRPFADRVRLIESPMEVDPGVPPGHFDLVFSIYGIGWSTDLAAALALAARYLRPGGCLVVSGEHPFYSCLDWNGSQYYLQHAYSTEGPVEHASWKGVPIVIQRCTLGSFIERIVQAGLAIERVVEPPLEMALASEAHVDPARWYSVSRARMMPTTFVIKARKPA